MKNNKKENHLNVGYFCCKEMLRLVNDPECVFIYNKSARIFGLAVLPSGYNNDNYPFSVYFQISHCPMCGAKFPVDLFDYRGEILEREFGLKLKTNNIFDSSNDVPSEFLTDAWWISRKNCSDFPIKEKTWLDRIKEDIFSNQESSNDEKAKELSLATELYHYSDNDDLGDFCCHNFKISIEPNCDECVDGSSCSDFTIIYVSEKRQYRLTSLSHRHLKSVICRPKPKRKLLVNIFFCPRCGAKLPKSLAGRWYKEIHEKFGVYDILSKSEMAKVPQKYLTDQWWKELGL